MADAVSLTLLTLILTIAVISARGSASCETAVWYSNGIKTQRTDRIHFVLVSKDLLNKKNARNSYIIFDTNLECFLVHQCLYCIAFEIVIKPVSFLLWWLFLSPDVQKYSSATPFRVSTTEHASTTSADTSADVAALRVSTARYVSSDHSQTVTTRLLFNV